jgi:hypothetical protein
MTELQLRRHRETLTDHKSSALSPGCKQTKKKYSLRLSSGFHVTNGFC